jgi:uncharacterized membrane protein YhaH (DUF805 family)
VPTGKSYWFPAKRYGWGWGPPITWQGWVVTTLWAAALLAGLFLLPHNHYELASRLGFVVIMSVIIVLICYWKGEPPKWRWGDRSE